MDHPPDITRLGAGRHLALLAHDGWEYVTRTTARGVVGVVALTPDREVLLVEQYRPPVGCRVLELPAGLVGDATEETVLEAASRELYEETGYRAPDDRLQWLMRAPSSAGLTDEVVELVLARDVTRCGPGGGVDGERIELLVVPLDELDEVLGARAGDGVHVDFKVRLVPLLAGTTSPEVSR
ncbi:MAG: NUDIX hydrolase [Planctomycetota bacterium]|nr:NUDIX hydrolase [Planctomycetota bacterium]MEC8733885.1 NUDIX hydrolase [Planctomycetota bacterium]MEC9158666.1 NUDIX hydrolase [Planctomycetota bacterium]MED5506568.1 NUDIX hydrolase [Planctomycetota bacterium]